MHNLRLLARRLHTHSVVLAWEIAAIGVSPAEHVPVALGSSWVIDSVQAYSISGDFITLNVTPEILAAHNSLVKVLAALFAQAKATSTNSVRPVWPILAIQILIRVA